MINKTYHKLPVHRNLIGGTYCVRINETKMANNYFILKFRKVWMLTSQPLWQWRRPASPQQSLSRDPSRSWSETKIVRNFFVSIHRNLHQIGKQILVITRQICTEFDRQNCPPHLPFGLESRIKLIYFRLYEDKHGAHAEKIMDRYQKLPGNELFR